MFNSLDLLLTTFFTLAFHEYGYTNFAPFVSIYPIIATDYIVPFYFFPFIESMC